MEMFRIAVRPAALNLIALVTVACLATSLSAQDLNETQLTSSSTAAAANHTITRSVERMQMLVKSSSILTLDAKIPRFQVHNEEVLGATPISQNQLQVFAKTPGTTQINLWDIDDKQYTVDITVIADAREIEGVLSAQLPLATLKVMPVNASAIVSGYVTSVDDVDRAIAIVEQYYPTVVNNIRVVGVQQVLLHTRIMEVSRTKLRELGVDLSWTDGSRIVDNLPVGIPFNNATNVFQGDEFTALVNALRQQDLIKFLAEPTVVATHGRPARFTVGGSVPYIVPSGNNTVTVKYEEYGTSVDFLPFVVGPGRVRLEIRPEVKEPDPSLSISASDINVTAFRQRYVDTAVELQAGQTFAIAGLLQSRAESTTKATPFIGELPVIGAFFRGVRERRNDVELLITVTPELIDAMDPHQVPRGGPGLNSMPPNDHDLYFNGHIEVPNLLGGDGCSMNSGPPASNDASMLHTNVMQNGAMMAHGSLMSPGMGLPPGATINQAPSLPADAVVPGSEPTVVGEGVILSTPDGY
ncbi:pilus assembly protein N-terminal domain-containing protein [Stieleria sp. TO1_6]|uniref:type II and III secretion system protein family protein n=1 Tax=Stieleria tagensis TaxID=2956795 RepID=UPI00209B9E5C|nr:pilus assembly protein N-terminal domain-containing protein [Stieleria tagensis]MCO8121773.1 pilus assembly protein N-terminal domain-containing protein [Stieleria tagensis]